MRNATKWSRQLRSAGFSAAALLVVFGCGGSGGDSGSASTLLNVFATDNLSAGYDQVWVTAYKIALTGAEGEQVVFEDTEGRVIDLRSLRDATGRRFSLLSNRAIRSGRFTTLTVTLSENVNILPTGATAAVEATFEGSTGGRKSMSVALPSGLDFRTRRELIVDFDLANWNLAGTTVSATGGNYLAIVEDASVGDRNRHERGEYRGTIANLTGTAPTFTFQVVRGPFTVNVKTNDSTAIFNENGADSPALANNQKVEVLGSFSSADNAILATRIKIDNENDTDRRVLGRVTGFSTADNVITMEVRGFEGGLPGRRAVNVRYATDARFFGERGLLLSEADFEAALANERLLGAEGNLVGSTLTAFKLKLEDARPGGPGEPPRREAEVIGTPINIEAATGKFGIRVQRWQGILGRPDGTINVATATATQYRVNNAESNSAAFFTALAGTGIRVKVEGQFNPETRSVTARFASITPID